MQSIHQYLVILTMTKNQKFTNYNNHTKYYICKMYFKHGFYNVLIFYFSDTITRDL